mmetsp:Transcript_3199/g.8197  ORF Transcript_3199/g.8197 Transcript_3199/m.8197 type:complete len:211 (-) Transcript_3199:420-1052(-)
MELKTFGVGGVLAQFALFVFMMASFDLYWFEGDISRGGYTVKLGITGEAYRCLPGLNGYECGTATIDCVNLKDTQVLGDYNEWLYKISCPVSQGTLSMHVFAFLAGLCGFVFGCMNMLTLGSDRAWLGAAIACSAQLLFLFLACCIYGGGGLATFKSDWGEKKIGAGLTLEITGLFLAIMAIIAHVISYVWKPAREPPAEAPERVDVVIA